MKSQAMRSVLILSAITVCVGLLFQNCSPVAFTPTPPDEKTLEQASVEPKLCADGEVSGSIKWDVVLGQSIEEPGQCSLGGDLTLIYEKVQKSLCEDGKYVGKSEFKKGKLIGQKGGCNCDAGITNGTSTWKTLVGQTLSDQQACPASGTLTLIYEKQQKYTCNNGTLAAVETFQKGNLIRQEGACMCADGSGEGSSQFKIVPNATIIEPGVCTYGGNLQKIFEKLQKFTCTSSQSTAQNEFKKGNLLNTTGACNCDGGTISGSTRLTIIAGEITEPAACKYGGTLVNVYQKQEKQLCTAGLYSNTGQFQKGAFIRQDGACNPPPVLSETMSVSATKTLKPLDMVWVIDNSGSMDSEAANVRANLTAFINGLDTSTDMKFILISQKGNSGTAVSLPSGRDPSRFIQINETVTSTSATKNVIDQLSALEQKGTPFFRAGSKKIIVFVTDDNSAMSAANFTSSLTMLGAAPGEVASFGFIGLGKTLSKCQANTGSVYQTLATQTKAKVFNICDIDWKQHFADLKTDVLTKLGRTFQLTDRSAAKITKVEVDGVALATGQYSFVNGVLTLSEDVVMTEQSTVKVYYTQE